MTTHIEAVPGADTRELLDHMCTGIQHAIQDADLDPHITIA